MICCEQNHRKYVLVFSSKRGPVHSGVLRALSQSWWKSAFRLIIQYFSSINPVRRLGPLKGPVYLVLTTYRSCYPNIEDKRLEIFLDIWNVPHEATFFKKSSQEYLWRQMKDIDIVFPGVCPKIL